MNNYHFGVVEDRLDPLKLGRLRVRIVGLHNENKAELPTEDLPWATPVQNFTSAAMNGIGFSPTGPVEGTWVLCIFTDESMQTPIILGTVGGFPLVKDVYLSEVESDQMGGQPSGAALTPSAPPLEPDPPVPPEPSYVGTGTGGIVTDSEGAPVTTGDPNEGVTPEGKYLGSLTKDQYAKIKQHIGNLESSNNYQAIEKNNGHYLGKYQIGAGKLVDYGYIKGDAYKKYGAAAVDHADAWVGKEGITSKQDFLNNPVLQENLMDRMLHNNYKQLVKGTGIKGEEVDPAKLGGLLYVAHNQGAGTAIKYVNSEGAYQTKDGNGLTTLQAYKNGYAGIAGFAPKSAENPTPKNIKKPACTNPSPKCRGNCKRFDVSKDPTSKKEELQDKQCELDGFKDPFKKYPLETHLNEPDTNRLSRAQKVNETIVNIKEQERIQHIPVANSSTTWYQPYIPYNAKYPYNHVYQSESGHIMEFDDTKGFERTHFYHKSGTFSEVDHHGTKTDRVKGARVVIVEKDDLVYVIGSGHVAIQGDMSVKIMGNSNIDVAGNASMNVEGNYYVDVKGDWHNNVRGNYYMTVQEDVHWITEKVHRARAGSGSNDPDYASEIPAYSPSIVLPTPFTRKEEESITLEHTDEAAKKADAASRDSTSPTPSEEQKDEEKPKEVEPETTECDFILPLSPSTKLTANFRLKDLIMSGHRFPYGGEWQGLKDTKIACNLKHLCMNVVEPLFEKYGGDGITINSGFRSLGGNSQHERGQAVDIGFGGHRGNRQFYFDKAKEIKNLVPYDQLLLEYDGGSVWIHISFSQESNRKQILTLNNHRTYGQGLILLA